MRQEGAVHSCLEDELFPERSRTLRRSRLVALALATAARTAQERTGCSSPPGTWRGSETSGRGPDGHRARQPPAPGGRGTVCV